MAKSDDAKRWPKPLHQSVKMLNCMESDFCQDVSKKPSFSMWVWIELTSIITLAPVKIPAKTPRTSTDRTKEQMTEEEQAMIPPIMTVGRWPNLAMSGAESIPVVEIASKKVFIICKM